ncbi:MAG: prolyl oligopeptidase family serine peptidase [Prevotellaceae bacterium]|nr:prolyl oligopeptidase family serine peptidase [Prevotellaceae bacterium]
MLPRWLVILTLLLCLPSGARAQSTSAHKGDVAGAYPFLFYDPAEGDTPPDAHFPLLIFLHGASLCGNNLNKVKRYGPFDAMQKGINIDCYVLAPQNPGGSWKPEKIWKAVEWAQQHYHVDSTRVYVYGMSLGGYGTIDFAATYPDRVAAAMAICGGGSVSQLGNLSKLPLWILHGTADRAVPIKESERVVAAIKATGDDSRLIFTRLAGVDHGRPARIFYIAETYDWLFSHSTQDEDRAVCRDFEITAQMLERAYSAMKDVDYERE